MPERPADVTFQVGTTESATHVQEKPWGLVVWFGDEEEAWPWREIEHVAYRDSQPAPTESSPHRERDAQQPDEWDTQAPQQADETPSPQDVSLRTELVAHFVDHDVPLVPEEDGDKFYLEKEDYIEDFDRWVGNERVNYDEDAPEARQNWIAKTDVKGYIRETGGA